MDDHANINVTRRIALMTAMGALLLGCAGNRSVLGAVVGASAFAGAVGSAVRREPMRKQPHIDKAQNVRAASRPVTFPRKSGHGVMRLLPLPAVG